MFSEVYTFLLISLLKYCDIMPLWLLMNMLWGWIMMCDLIVSVCGTKLHPILASCWIKVCARILELFSTAISPCGYDEQSINGDTRDCRSWTLDEETNCWSNCVSGDICEGEWTDNVSGRNLYSSYRCLRSGPLSVYFPLLPDLLSSFSSFFFFLPHFNFF